ncbi:hypothetical protein BHECKSOX2_714 [Bathymodiolus heckerae thiotrophic gill symbiont]|uniref:glucosamine--fructose-6-phosphate aminotransferase n=1 Tax=Bathymodiolus heckerae thiotrophic gill symbiont TaxID=1052212 RepID=UPI0010B41F00|nr:glucosamine--fructose-6-phosphate aminotransferase [Bathymodiolus heckerae thiotrophic gill symbiont]SMN13591.1 hypothetical protein BHECKSOX2_714 [Bathymodiolus heckerae thiotrophic gill symbiont]
MSPQQALKYLTLDNLPLIECCRHSGNIDEDSIDISLFSSAESEQVIQLKIGVFFREIIPGCTCSDDPLQAISYENGYCELQVKVDKNTSKVSFISS